MSMWRAWSRIFLGRALASQGKSEDGLAEIKAGLLEADRQGAGCLMPLLLGLAAEAEMLAGNHGAAMARIGDAFRALECGQDLA